MVKNKYFKLEKPNCLLIKWIKKSPLKNNFLSQADVDMLFLAKNEKEALKIINLTYEEYKKGKKNICLNIKKYKI